jgi:hypothetical protein
VQIGGVTLTPADQSWLEQAAARPKTSRTSLARSLCERLSLKDACGRPRLVTARIALSRQARAGKLALPAVANPFGEFQRRVIQRPTRPRKARELPTLDTLPSLASLTVHRVAGPSDPWHAAWKKSLDEHHYLGSGPLCGAQLRYVVCVQQQVLAAVSFSAAAFALKARDKHIGWSASARRRNLPLVICQSRFCLTVCVHHLASRVQAILLRRVSADWQQAYGRRPVLAESYVDLDQFDGTCYRASNWNDIGCTAGRGRQDRAHRAATSIKRVFLFPLDPKWKEILRVKPVRPLDQHPDWAQTEWGAVDLKDQRLTRRLVSYGRACGERPTANLPQTCGSAAATKATYRLLNHPQASLESFLSEHRESTLSRAREHRVVLAIQDTTSLNYTSHPATEDLGPIGSHGASSTQGLEVHSLLLSNLEGTPLGLLNIQAWARDPKTYGTAKERAKRPTSKKESQKWLNGYAAADLAATRLETTDVVVVGDREADMFDLLKLASKGRAKLLVRALHQRRILTEDGKTEGKLWDSVRDEPVATPLFVDIPRRGKRLNRPAHLELRFREVLVARPRKSSDPIRSIQAWAIAVTETEESAGDAEPLEWLLLTTIPITTKEEAEEKVRWYILRWLIEVFHRTLKTGCQIERRQSHTAKSLEAGLAIDAIVAWRVMWLWKLHREAPNLPCSVFFAEHEWKALYCFSKKTRNPPQEPPTMREAMRMVAMLGGFLGRKSDGNPGTQVTWRGLERLTDIAETFAMFFSSA